MPIGKTGGVSWTCGSRILQDLWLRTCPWAKILFNLLNRNQLNELNSIFVPCSTTAIFSKLFDFMVVLGPFLLACEHVVFFTRFEILYLKDVGDTQGIQVTAWPGAPPSHPQDIVCVVRQQMSSRQFHQIALLVPGRGEHVLGKCKSIQNSEGC